MSNKPTLPEPGNYDNHIEAEKALVGAVLKDPVKLTGVQIHVTDDCFLDDRNRFVWRAMVELETRNEPIDLATVSDMLTHINAKVGPVYLVGLTESAPVTRNMEHYSKLVLQNWGDRKARELMDLAARQTYVNIDSIITRLTTLNYDLKSVARSGTPWSEPADSIFDFIETGDSEIIEGVMTQEAFPKLNEMSQVARGDLIIIGGMTSMGKTAFALRYCSGLIKTGYKGMYFLYEGSDNSLQRRIIAQESGVELQKLRKPNTLSASEKKKVLDLRGIFEDQLVYYDNGTTATDILNKIKMFIDANGSIDFVCIDHIHLMPLEKENIRMGIIDLTKKLIKFGKDEGILIIGLAQFRKEDAGRDKERPNANSLRESSTIKQDAHHIWLLHDPEFLAEKEKTVVSHKFNIDAVIGVVEKEPAEIIVDKNREGTTGIIPAKFNRSIGVWKEI